MVRFVALFYEERMGGKLQKDLITLSTVPTHNVELTIEIKNAHKADKEPVCHRA